jgi:hypothetical protein
MNNDLISRSALLATLDELYMVALRKSGVSVESVYHLEHFAMLVKDAPAVDAEPVEHSMWLEHPAAQKTKYWTCLKCDTMGSPRWKRCPVCEAKMEVMKYD